ncbi:DUF2155 domain-containing protein [Inquilinus sp. OTU3971]|uniref:DUF2155 domain-containing protein n=1 Tax=Inquilinus sp. OTU3971 TaxID=3043855 RepID=UPI00313B5395
MRSLLVLPALAVLAAASLPGAAQAAATIDQPIAELRGLDKITARTQPLEAKVGETVQFGTLGITVRACRKAPPEDPPESAAFLEITDTPPSKPAATVFSGWMFSSSPGVSALDHPVYDVWVVSCTDTSPAAAAAQQEVDENVPDASPLPLPEMKIIPPALPPGRQ